MKLHRILFFAAFLLFTNLTIGQTDLDITSTMSLADFNDNFNEKDYAFFDFVKANVHQSKRAKKSGIIEDQKVNYHRPSKTFYVLEDDKVYTLNNANLQGIYVIGGHPFIKLDQNDNKELCEVVHMTEKMYVFLHNNKTYARLGDKNIEMERSCPSIEDVFGVHSESVGKYIAINNLNINNVEDFKLILKHYENAFYNKN